MPRNPRKDGGRAANGASSIFYSETDGCWHGFVVVGVKDDGSPDRRHVKRKGKDAEKQCRAAVRRLENDRDAGKIRKPGRPWKVKQWLEHWVENIAAPSVRETTMVGYRASVYKHLIPGLGNHRIDSLQPEHIESLYARMLDAGLKAGTVHLAHRTLRAALNEAVRRRHFNENPAKIAKAPSVDEEEIVPFTVDEARRILAAAENVRNGARYVLALTLGLRRGEALGLKWADLDVTWKHGCADDSECRALASGEECPDRRGGGKLTIRRSIQQRVWKHGCGDSENCEGKSGGYCPKRQGGGVFVTDVKYRAERVG